METLSQLVRRVRKEKQLTIKQMAEIIGISAVELNNIELAKNRPTTKTTFKLADFFDMDFDDLFNKKL